MLALIQKALNIPMGLNALLHCHRRCALNPTNVRGKKFTTINLRTIREQSKLRQERSINRLQNKEQAEI